MDRISECLGDCDDQDLGGEEQPRGSMDKVDPADVWRRNYATFMEDDDGVPPKDPRVVPPRKKAKLEQQGPAEARIVPPRTPSVRQQMPAGLRIQPTSKPFFRQRLPGSPFTRLQEKIDRQVYEAAQAAAADYSPASDCSSAEPPIEQPRPSRKRATMDVKAEPDDLMDVKAEPEECYDTHTFSDWYGVEPDLGKRS